MYKILLDTNAYSAYRRGDKDIFEELASADRVYLSVIVLGELFYGFKSGKHEDRNRSELKQFMKKPRIRLIQSTLETADIFSEIKLQLKKSGTPIPVNDLWIGAHCLEQGAKIISYDKHFSYIKGLRTWK